MESIRLTQFSHGSGCGCKIAPADLEQILQGHRSSADFKQLLVGNQSSDDAAVWDLGDGQALISTVDFFLPIVDDAFDFGRIAATNALSDVYAMGGKPIFANALLGWPLEKLAAALAAEVLNGSRAVCEKAGIPIAGGHSINGSDPLFGLAVNGLAASKNIKQNNTAKAGDVLYLTKPLGTGVMGTAIKRGLAKPEHVMATIEWMCTLNSVGQELGNYDWVHAMTDVTGFGLLGHLLEMAEGSALSASIDFAKVPLLPFLDEYLQQNIIPDNTYRNWNSWEKKVNGITDMKSFQVLNDPQTSGGLLVAVDAAHTEEMELLLNKHEVPVYKIGALLVQGEKQVQVNL